MDVEEALRTIALTLVRFSSFGANAILFGIVPVALLVVRPALLPLDDARWGPGRKRVADRLEGLTQAALLGSLVATIVGLVLQATLVGSFRGGEVDATAFEAVVGTAFGRWYLLRLPLLAAVFVLVVGNVRRWSLDRVSRPGWWSIWALLAAALLATSTMSGHSTVAQPRILAMGNDILHLLSTATWFTGIVVLAVILPDAWRGKDQVGRLEALAPSVVRFSIVAPSTIAVIAVTGSVNSFLHVGSPGDLVSTPYGWTLTVKLALFVLILALGGTNHLFLRRRMQRGLEQARVTGAQFTFRRTIGAELAVGIGLMLATGVLTGLARTA